MRNDEVLKILDEKTNVEAATEGACHCEAGIIASLALRQVGATSGEIEPEVLAKAFAAFEPQLALEKAADKVAGQPQPPTLTIGVAKKCCPVCRLLLRVVRETYGLHLEITGSHNRYHPWIPPEWLPQPVMESLERELVDVVVGMLDLDHLATSRASSPTSDSTRANVSDTELPSTPEEVMEDSDSRRSFDLRAAMDADDSAFDDVPGAEHIISDSPPFAARRGTHPTL
ncbi:hypothetical protein GGX14DRAFT_390927 [Mycena pura]|uniref:Uncharacterized protein n=1 Tax=Mycena pura TaxID=153505 RepID=A0AAD6VQ97_9AGAR|nr:hypothetical protein GGX14DRAFT_390927 [Mycena pura]